MDIDDLNSFLRFQMFSKLCNVNIHAPGVEVIVVNPDRFECEISFQNFIGIDAQQFKQIRLLGWEVWIQSAPYRA